MQIYILAQLFSSVFSHYEKETMKKISLILLVLVVGIILFSCKDEIQEQYIYEYGLKLNDVYQTKGNSIKFTVTEINDSRCPSDVVCVWAGMVEVKFAFDAPEKKMLSLNSYNNLADTIGIYEIRLVEVQPYPVSTKQIKLEDYKVSLKITTL